MRATVNKTYIVLYLKGGRIASFENTGGILASLRDRFLLSLIQVDKTGTKHYNILAVTR